MLVQSSKVAGLALLATTLLFLSQSGGQETTAPPTTPVPVAVDDKDDAADVPKGVEVLARGPVHEAFAAPTVEPKATPLVAKKPPTPLEEMAPEDKPEGDVLWISGYWAFDDERGDYLWVSGCWRTRPPEKEWIAGYWREQGDEWQWVPGFWTSTAPAGKANEVVYYPEPPAPPALAPPGDPPTADAFYVPGNWVWQEERYAWRPGYWARIHSGYVWVPSHYRWTPHGHVFVAGYWDLAVTRRGILYAPVTVDVVVVGPRYVYTPRYAVCDAVVMDAFFVRPAHCHYYFGDYYGPVYHRMGYESCVVYSRRCYDPVIVYHRWERRSDPTWLEVHVHLTRERDAGRAPRPPRTLVQQNTIVKNTSVTNVTNVYNTTVIAPTKVVASARGEKTVALDKAARAEVQEVARAARTSAIKERQVAETPAAGPPPSKPRVASLSVPPSVPSRSGMGAAAKIGPDAKGATTPKAVTGAPPTARTPDKGIPDAKDTTIPKTSTKEPPAAKTPEKGTPTAKDTTIPKTLTGATPKTPDKGAVIPPVTGAGTPPDKTGVPAIPTAKSAGTPPVKTDTLGKGAASAPPIVSKPPAPLVPAKGLDKGGPATPPSVGGVVTPPVVSPPKTPAKSPPPAPKKELPKKKADDKKKDR